MRNRKQLTCEIPRDIAWEKRRGQLLRQERRKSSVQETDHLTDEDLKELKGCIDLGFGFNEEEGQKLCNTIPALDMYFAVNRNYSTSPLSSPASNGSSTLPTGSFSAASTPLGGRTSSCGSLKGDNSDAWKICGPGDDPQQVKTKLRHWAQIVACSVKQSF